MVYSRNPLVDRTTAKDSESTGLVQETNINFYAVLLFFVVLMVHILCMVQISGNCQNLAQDDGTRLTPSFTRR